MGKPSRKEARDIIVDFFFFFFFFRENRSLSYEVKGGDKMSIMALVILFAVCAAMAIGFAIAERSIEQDERLFWKLVNSKHSDLEEIVIW